MTIFKNIRINFICFFIASVCCTTETKITVRLRDATFKTEHTNYLAHCPLHKGIVANEYIITYAPYVDEYDTQYTLLAIWDSNKKNIYTMQYTPHVNNIAWNPTTNTLTLFYKNHNSEVLDILKNIEYLSYGFYQDTLQVKPDTSRSLHDFIYHLHALITHPYSWIVATTSYLAYKIYKRICTKSVQKNTHIISKKNIK